MILGDAAIFETQGGRIGSTNPHLLFAADHFHARRVGGNHKGFDSAPARALVHRGPNHGDASIDRRGLLARGAEDLVAVQDPLLGFGVEVRSGLDGRRIRTRRGFGDRHGAPDGMAILPEGREEALALFRRARRAHCRTTESGRGHAEVEATISPTDLFRLDADRDEAVRGRRKVERRALSSDIPPMVDPFDR